jgi:hypothetical protein
MDPVRNPYAPGAGQIPYRVRQQPEAQGITRATPTARPEPTAPGSDRRGGDRAVVAIWRVGHFRSSSGDRARTSISMTGASTMTFVMFDSCEFFDAGAAAVRVEPTRIASTGKTRAGLTAMSLAGVPSLYRH